MIDVALHTVKVQNWDKTITTIPTHKLIETSFKNWRGMQEGGGRRIKRSNHVDLNSIRFCDEEMLERLSDDFFCVAPDQRGYGQTGGPDGAAGLWSPLSRRWPSNGTSTRSRS